MPKVLISDKLSPAAVAIFQARGIETDIKTGLSPADLRAIIGEYDGLAIRSATKVTAEVLAVPSVADPEEDTAWDLVLALASEFDTDVIREAVTPQTGAADAMIERLTPAQRSELARLLQQEMGTN